MRTVQEIFDEAIHLIDAQNEQTGSTNTTDTKEYEVRACKCLSTLLNEAYPYSDTYRAEEYDGAEAYAAGECVDYEGVRYLRLTDADENPEDTPDVDTTHWRRIGKAGRRPTHPPVAELTDAVYMDDFICLSALPAGLAALFVYDEDTTKYNAFWGDYTNRLPYAVEATLYLEPPDDRSEPIKVQRVTTLPTAFLSWPEKFGKSSSNRKNDGNRGDSNSGGSQRGNSRQNDSGRGGFQRGDSRQNDSQRGGFQRGDSRQNDSQRGGFQRGDSQRARP